MKQSILFAIVSFVIFFCLNFGAPKTIASSGCYTFTKNITAGSALTSAEASALQNDLIKENLWFTSTNITTYSPSLLSAVIAFQNKYSTDILKPVGLKKGTGYFGAYTRGVINNIYGCGSIQGKKSESSTVVSTLPTSKNSVAGCPARFVCTPIKPKVAVACPVGFICTPKKTPDTLAKNSSIKYAQQPGLTLVDQTSINTSTYTSASDQLNQVLTTLTHDNTGTTNTTSDETISVDDSTTETTSSSDTTPDPVIVTTIDPAPPVQCTSSSPEASLFLIMGQSNAVGAGKISKISPTIISDFQANNWPFHIWSGGSQTAWKDGSDIQTIQGKYFGPDLNIASQLITGGLRDFYIFKYAVGGTSLGKDWKSRGGGGLYDKAVIALNNAKKEICATGKNPVVKALFWMQGETDAADANLSVSYGPNLRRFVSQSRVDFLDNTTPLVIGLIDTAGNQWAYGTIVRNWQKSVASTVNRIGWVETNDLSIYPAPCTGSTPECLAHYDTNGQINLGQRFYDKYLDL